MPEGHTLHRLALDHRRELGGRQLGISSPQGRFQSGAKALDGAVLTGVRALGKHLLYEFDSGHTLHVHLGLFGKFRRQKQPAAAPRGQVRLRMESDEVCIDLAGPTACELFEPVAVAALEARIGPDLLDANADSARAWELIHRSKRPIGALLLDQSILSGVGNVYRAEALFVTGIHPETPGCDIDRRAFRRLWKTLVSMLLAGVKDRRIITVPYKGSAKNVQRHERLWVYKRRECRRCESPIRWWDLGTRRMYACEECQRR